MIFVILLFILYLFHVLCFTFHLQACSNHWMSHDKFYPKIEYYCNKKDEIMIGETISSPQSMRNQVILSSNQWIRYKLSKIFAILFSLPLLTNAKDDQSNVDANTMITTSSTVTTTPDDSIDLNVTFPPITDICWMDIAIDNHPSKRIEISLFGSICPITVENFKTLCTNSNSNSNSENKNDLGYTGSNIFRIISTFSIQGGNIGFNDNISSSQMAKYGRSATGVAFPPENYQILHSYALAGVISMMKDITNNNKQDSRFFITLSPSAGWADNKYVAFGLVTKGMDFILNDITSQEVVPPSNYPIHPIKIVGSGCYDRTKSKNMDVSEVAKLFIYSHNRYLV